MRMSEKVSSSISYAWSGLVGFLGSISTDGYMIMIALMGMVTTAFINNYWQKRRFKAEFGSDQD